MFTEAIESVVIRNNTVPISSANFTLTCEVSGPYDNITWIKDKMQLSMNTSFVNETMTYRIENNTLHFTGVTIDNDGIYKCVATNQASERSSLEYILLVNCEFIY